MKNRRVGVILLAGLLYLLEGAPTNSNALEQIASQSGRTGTVQQAEYFGIADEILQDYENKGRTRIHIRSRSGRTAGTISLDPYIGSVEIFRYTLEGTETITLNSNSATIKKQRNESCKVISSPKDPVPKDCYVRPRPVVSTSKGNYSDIIQNLGELEESIRRGVSKEVYIPTFK